MGSEKHRNIGFSESQRTGRSILWGSMVLTVVRRILPDV